MSETIVLNAEPRTANGKGASRRLRRTANRIPGIIYGGGKEPASITICHNEIIKKLENEAFYSSILSINVDGKAEKAILKDLQRHPYKPKVMHLDLLRVSSKDSISMQVPIHFLGEDVAPGAKAGGLISHNFNEVEIKCMAKDLPEFIEVDVSAIDLDGSVHLSGIKLPKGVELVADISDSAHDAAIFAIHKPKAEEEISDEAPVAPAAPETDVEGDEEATKE